MSYTPNTFATTGSITFTAGTGNTLQLGAAAALHDRIIVAVLMQGGASAVAAPTVTDATNSGTYTEDMSLQFGSFCRVSLFSLANVAAVQATIKVVPPVTGLAGGFAVTSYSGLLRTDPGGAWAKATSGTGGTASSGASAPVAHSGDTAIGIYTDTGWGLTLSGFQGSGWTQRGVHQSDGASYELLWEDQLTTAFSAVTANLAAGHPGASNQWQMMACTYLQEPPASTIISNVSFGTPLTFAQGTPDSTSGRGSDLWPVTWANDGNLYVAWGDGGGLGGGSQGTTDAGYVSWGFGKITASTPAALVEANGTYPPSGNMVNVDGVTGGSSAWTAPFAVPFGGGHGGTGKVATLLGAGGTIYGILGPLPANSLIRTTDHGATWSQAPWSFDSSVYINFVQHDQDNAGSPGGYIYAVAFDVTSTNRGALLARVQPANAWTQSSWEWFSGLSGSTPTWTSTFANAVAIGGPEVTGGGSLFAIAGLGRYVWVISRGGAAVLDVWESPTLWGPFAIVKRGLSLAGALTTSENLNYTLVSKWTNAPGSDSWMLFSVYGTGDAYHDRLALVEMTLTLIPQGGGSPPAGTSNHLPTYSCEMNLSANLTGYFQIGSSLIGTGQIGGPYGVGSWTDLTARLEGFSTSRGRQDELSGVTSGTIQAQLHDDDAAFDPDYTFGAYYPNLKIMRQFRVTATWAGTAYTLGYGFMDSLQALPLPVQADVLLSATDLFKRLDLRKTAMGFAQATITARLNSILDVVQWPAGQRAIDVSTTVVPAISTVAGTSLLSHIDSLMKASQGDFFIARDGTATYHNTSKRLTAASRATFGSGGLPIRNMTATLRDTLILNEVHCLRTGGVDQIASDTASQATYDIRTYTVDQNAADCLMSDVQANALAHWILGLRAQPVQRIDTLELDGTADDTLWPHILGADIGDRITVTHDLPGTRGISAQDYFIESVRHTWSPTNQPEHICQWGLSKASALGTYYIIGTSLIGTGKVGY